MLESLLLNILSHKIYQHHLNNTGVVEDIIAVGIAAYMFNHFYRIKLLEYLGFSGKGFVPIISGFFAILLWVLLAFIGPLIGRKI